MGYHRLQVGRVRAFVLTFSLVVGYVVLAPAASHAIPSAGTYGFTSGLNGAFTSDGSQLTAWEIDDPYDTNIHWSNTKLFPNGLQDININDTSTFITNNFGHYFFTIDWINGTWTDMTTLPSQNIVAAGDFTYEGRTVVPEPGTASLLVLGLLALVAYGWQRRHAGAQVG